MSDIGPANLAAWFAQHAPSLTLYARHWLDRAAAEDVVQDVFVRLLGLRSAPPNVRAWLFVATRNAAIAALRSAKRQAKRRRSQAEQGQRGEPWFQSDPAARLDAEAAEAALRSLPPPQREVVLLRIWGGLTLAEISSLLGLAISTVHDRHRAALHQMRLALEPTQAARSGSEGRARGNAIAEDCSSPVESETT